MRISWNRNTVIFLWVFAGLGIITAGSRWLAGRPVEPDATAQEIAPLTVPVPDAVHPLQELWRKHKIAVSLDPLRDPLPRLNLLKEPVRLSAANARWSSEKLELELALEEKAHAMGHRDTHAVILRIRNASSSPVAFLVDTEPGKLFVDCRTFRKIQAHQFLLPAGGSVERMEGCTATPADVDLVVRRVQVMPLPEAAMITLSRVLQPLGLSYRMRSQHKTPDIHLLPPCIIPDAEILQNRISQNPEAWFDIIDFLARHDCATEKLP